jgi:quinol monooxygenase YgiN
MSEHAIIVTRMVVHSHLVERAVDVFRAMQDDVRAQEPGTVFYAYYQADDDPTVFWVHEVFADDAAKQFHLGNHAQRRSDFDAILAEPPDFHMVHEL